MHSLVGPIHDCVHLRQILHMLFTGFLGQERKILQKPEQTSPKGKIKLLLISGGLNKHCRGCFCELWLYAAQHKHFPPAEPLYKRFTSPWSQRFGD